MPICAPTQIKIKDINLSIWGHDNEESTFSITIYTNKTSKKIENLNSIQICEYLTNFFDTLWIEKELPLTIETSVLTKEHGFKSINNNNNIILSQNKDKSFRMVFPKNFCRLPNEIDNLNEKDVKKYLRIAMEKWYLLGLK